MLLSNKYILINLFFKSYYNVDNFKSINRKIITIINKFILDSYFLIIE